MEISREAAEIIRDFFPLSEIEACLELETGLEGNWGQTFLLLHPSGVWALTRGSYAEPCRKIRIDHHVPMHLQRRQFEETLVFADADGTSFQVRLYPANIEPVRAFIARVEEMRERLPDPEREKSAPAQKSRQKTKPETATAAAPKTGNSPFGYGGPGDAVRGEPVPDAADPLDAAGHSMQNFFERIIERIGDAPPNPPLSGEKRQTAEDSPSPDFLRLVDTGDVFARIPSRMQQAAEAYMAAWEKYPDPAVALKLADLYERLLQPEPRLLWLERAAEKMPPGSARDAVIDRIVVLMEQQGTSPEIVQAWKSRRSTK